MKYLAQIILTATISILSISIYIEFYAKDRKNIFALHSDEKLDEVNDITDRNTITAPNLPTPDDIVLADEYYVTAGRQIEIYRDNVFIGFPNNSNRSAILITSGTQSGRSTTIRPTEKHIGHPISLTAVISDENFNPDQFKIANIVVSDESVETAANILNIGDSLTGRSQFVNEILHSKARKGLTFIGNKISTIAAEQTRNEGEVGWTINAYNQVDYKDQLSPFMQPVKLGYHYYGRSEFWLKAYSSSPPYPAYNYYATKNLFSNKTGLLKSPKTGDIMSRDGQYLYWDGSSWNTIAEDEFNGFSFNFHKYRKAWNIEKPDIVHVLLGTNDFYWITTSEFDNFYASFKEKYDILIASIKADSPSVKIIIATPPTSARQGIHGTLESERVASAYKSLAKSLIRDYGNRKNENLYILDYQAVVDRDYGFESKLDKPFPEYSGEHRVKIISDITHPSEDGAAQMAKMYLGIIQHLR